MYPRNFFSSFAKTTSRKTGHPIAFMAALSVVLLWLVSGPFFHFSDTWQLVINTGTTILTFLMVFLLQNTQNRDNEAMQLKLDELIRATEGAHNSFLDLEELTDAQLEHIKDRYEGLAEQARQAMKTGKADTDRPDVVPEA
jgi:low affinity Fe/Cu permease